MGNSDSRIRLNKFIAQSGLCSRRKADVLIDSGKVTVNAEVITELGWHIDPATDIVKVNNQKIEPIIDFVYIMLNKPVAVITSVTDPQGRQTVLDLLPDEIKNKRVYPIGRLDFFSEGLLLLTNDGHMAMHLMHPRWHQPKIYEVILRGCIADEAINSMTHGMTLAEGEKLAPVEIKLIRRTSSTSQLHITLYQGLNRQIRRMCRDLNLTIMRLKRISQGPLILKNLEPGEWRYLTKEEIILLNDSIIIEKETIQNNFRTNKKI